MKEIKAVVKSSKGKVTVADLKRRFRTTTLGNAADSGDFETWIDDFKKGGSKDRSAGVGNHVLSFLSRKTGLTPETLKTYMKKVRSNRKSPTIP